MARVCTKCGREGDDFYTRKSGVVSSWCHECCKEYARARRAANPDKGDYTPEQKAQMADPVWLATPRTCPDCGVTRTEADWYVRKGRGNAGDSCKECRKMGSKKWQQANPEKATEYNARHKARLRSEADPEARTAYLEAERVRAAAKYRANTEAILERSRRNRAADRAEMLAAYGGACECCGETTPEFLAIDHTNGNGAAERRAHRTPIMGKLKKAGWPREGYRLLCHNCNMALGINGFCPHNPDKTQPRQWIGPTRKY